MNKVKQQIDFMHFEEFEQGETHCYQNMTV